MLQPSTATRKVASFCITTLMAGALLCSNAQAKLWNPSQAEHFPAYAGGGIGYGAGVEDGIGVTAYGGYSFNQNIAAEGLFIMTPAYYKDGHTYTGAATAKISFPLPNNIARHWIPYAQAGAAFTHWPHGNGTHVGFIVGGGVDYRLQHNIELGMKALAALSDNNPTIAVGTIAYRF